MFMFDAWHVFSRSCDAKMIRDIHINAHKNANLLVIVTIQRDEVPI